MRLILTILLIGLFKADAQMVINASSPYRPFVSSNLLLDDYPNAASAYSLRKLRNAYTGAAIRVRKDTTGQPEQDIGFTASGDLDTAQLKQFLNLRSGFVTTWYDQSGQDRNATQTVQANQPRIANLGVIDRASSRPSIQFNSHLLQVTMTGIDTVTRLQTYNVVNPALAAAANTTTEILWGYAGGGVNNTLTNRGISWGNTTGLLSGETFTMYFANATIAAGRIGNNTYTRNANTTILHTTENKNNRTDWYVNGGVGNTFNLTDGMTQTTNSSPSNCATTNTDFWIKSVNGATNATAQKYSELIIYYGVFDGYLSGVRSNINAYYGIY